MLNARCLMLDPLASHIHSSTMNRPTLPLIDPTFMFRFRSQLRRCKAEWTEEGIALSPQHKLPCFAEVSGKKLFADVRAGWHEEGLYFTAKITGKRQPPWCRDTRPEDSDGLHIWIDTRDTHNIHRASRFCHRFVFAPQGQGKAGIQPFGAMLPIHRAKEDPSTLGNHRFEVQSTLRTNGYEIAAVVPTDLLAGFNLEAHPRLGFFYAIADRELGWQTWNLGPEYPITEDPSLWGTVVLN